MKSWRAQWRCVCAWNVKAARAQQVWSALRRGGLPAELEGRIREIRMVHQWDQRVRFDVYVTHGAGDMSAAIGCALKCRARWHRPYQERELARNKAAEKLHRASGVMAKNDMTGSTVPPGAARSQVRGTTPDCAASVGGVHLQRMQAGPRRSERVVDTRAPGPNRLAQRLPATTDGHGSGPPCQALGNPPSGGRCGEQASQRGHKARPRAPFLRSAVMGELRVSMETGPRVTPGWVSPADSDPKRMRVGGGGAGGPQRRRAGRTDISPVRGQARGWGARIGRRGGHAAATTGTEGIDTRAVRPGGWARADPWAWGSEQAVLRLRSAPARLGDPESCVAAGGPRDRRHRRPRGCHVVAAARPVSGRAGCGGWGSEQAVRRLRLAPRWGSLVPCPGLSSGALQR